MTLSSKIAANTSTQSIKSIFAIQTTYFPVSFNSARHFLLHPEFIFVLTDERVSGLSAFSMTHNVSSDFLFNIHFPNFFFADVGSGSKTLVALICGTELLCIYQQTAVCARNTLNLNSSPTNGLKTDWTGMQFQLYSRCQMHPNFCPAHVGHLTYIDLLCISIAEFITALQG